MHIQQKTPQGLADHAILISQGTGSRHMGQFFDELKRRNVLRVAIAYLAVSWLLVQVVETLFPLFGLADALIRLMVIVLIIGFPLILVFSWLYELTPEGLKLDADVDRSGSAVIRSGKKWDRSIIVVLALALGYFAIDKFVLDPARDAEREKSVAERVRSEALVESFGENSIAVLPFVNLSDDASSEYFSDGVSEELLNLLTKIPQLRVISRSSSFSFKGRNLAIPIVAEQLNVSHVLEGSVQKAGDQIRITAKLIEARSDTQLWSDSYDRTLDDIFAIQDEIASAIAEQLELSLRGTPVSRVTTESVEAYQLYLQGRFELHQRRAESIRRSIGLLEQAISLDPNFARAYLELATAIYVLPGFAPLDRSETAVRARHLATKAHSLDPTLGKALALLALINQGEGDWKAARSGFEDALAIAKHESIIHLWYATLLASTGQTREALHEVQQSYELDPQSGLVLGWLCALNLSLGKRENTAQHCGNALSLGFAYANFLSALLQLAEGEYAHAESAFIAFSRKFSLDDSWVPGFMAAIRDPANRAMGIKSLESLESSLGRRWDLVGLYVLLGSNDYAFESAAHTEFGSNTSNHIWMPHMRAFRQDPRFAHLMEKTGLTDYWQHYGWPDSCQRVDEHLVCQ